MTSLGCLVSWAMAMARENLRQKVMVSLQTNLEALCHASYSTKLGRRHWFWHAVYLEDWDKMSTSLSDLPTGFLLLR